MPLLDRILDRMQRGNPAPNVQPGEEDWGHDQSTFSPPEYGDYIVTSNEVYSTANIRGKQFSKLPLQTFNSAGAVTEVGRLPQLIRRPNPHWTWRKLMWQTENSLAVWGQTYLIMERGIGGQGQPRELWWVKPTQMKPVPSKNDYLAGFLYSPPDGSRPMPFATSEVIWIAYPNIIDQYSGLSPVAAARLAADVATASMKANKSLFSQGLMPGGFVMPPDQSVTYTEQQARDLERKLESRFKGADKAHRWSVMRYLFDIKDMGITPRDAEFVEGLNLTFRMVCRAMGVPPPLVGDAEFATLANLRVYERQLWEQTLEPETEFIADELNRQLVPHFAGVDHVEFDLSGVVALQEDESERWSRTREKLELGVLTIDEAREEEGKEPVPWGSEPILPLQMQPLGTGLTITERKKEEEGSAERTLTRASVEALRRGRITEFTPDEGLVASKLEDLFGRQTDAVLRQLGQEGETSAADTPFNLEKWTRTFREELRSIIFEVGRHGVEWAAKQAGVTDEPGRSVQRGRQSDLIEAAALAAAPLLEEAAQTLAATLNRTTYEALRVSLDSGLAKQETVAQLKARIDKVMKGRISNSLTIAQTEVTRVVTDAQVITWNEAGVPRKRWLSQGDDRVRDSHLVLHWRTIGLNDYFDIGGCSGLGPGQSGCADQDIGCRCFLVPIAAARPSGVEVTSATLTRLIGKIGGGSADG